MNKKILVTIVTYNRLEELILCVESLRKQSVSCFDILVVNNGGQDKTNDWLLKQNDLCFISQDNQGGAGGFYTGMKYMLDNYYDWIVLMDDDGIADEEEVKSLIGAYDEVASYYGGDVILNSLVVDKDDRKKTAFIWSRGSKRSNDVAELMKEPYFADVHPFNGTLIKRSVIERIGLIKKEMFIWGDEKEYMARALHFGVGLYTVTKAIHYHPKEKGKKDNLLPLFSFIKVLVKPQKMSHYYYRNEGYIYWSYSHKRKRLVLFVMLYVVYFLSHFKFKELIKFVKYFVKGMRNIY